MKRSLKLIETQQLTLLGGPYFLGLQVMSSSKDPMCSSIAVCAPILSSAWILAPAAPASLACTSDFVLTLQFDLMFCIWIYGVGMGRVYPRTGCGTSAIDNIL